MTVLNGQRTFNFSIKVNGLLILALRFLLIKFLKLRK